MLPPQIGGPVAVLAMSGISLMEVVHNALLLVPAGKQLGVLVFPFILNTSSTNRGIRAQEGLRITLAGVIAPDTVKLFFKVIHFHTSRGPWRESNLLRAPRPQDCD